MEVGQRSIDNNEQAKIYLEEVFKLWTRDKTVKEEEYRKPTSKKQLVQSQELLDKAKELNPDDEWTVNRIAELQGVVDFNYKKVFIGINFLKWTGFIIAIVFFFLPALFFLKQADYTVEKVQAIKKERIEKLEKLNSKSQNKIDAINHGGKDYADWSDKKKKDAIKKYSGNIDKRNKKISKLNTISNDDFIKKLNSERRTAIFLRIVLGSLYFIAGLFYAPANTLPQYEIHRREMTFRARAHEKSVNIISNIGSFIFREFIVKQPSGYKVTYRYKDGSTSTEYQGNIIPVLAGFFLIWVPFMWYSYYITLYPLAVLINFLRNKVFFKG